MDQLLRRLSEKNRIDIGRWSPIRELDAKQLEHLASQFEEKNSIEIVTHSWVSGPEAVATQKTASFVSRITGLRNLRLFLNNDGSDTGACRRAVDVILDTMASSSAAELQKLDLNIFGESTDAWLRFTERFAAGIQELRVETNYARAVWASEALSSLPSRFSSLNALTLSIDVRSSNADTVNLLLGAATQMPIKELSMTIRDLADTFNIHWILDELEAFSQAVTRSNSLKAYSLTLTGLGSSRMDEQERTFGSTFGSVLLERLLRCRSLESISFTAVPVMHVNPALSINSHLKTMTFSACDIGEGCLSLISRLSGLESLRFDDVTLDMPVTGSFATFGHLKSFYVSTSRNQQLQWVASNLNVPSLRKLSMYVHGPVLPALRDVLVSCTSELLLTLQEGPESNTPILCAGIEAAQSLSVLRVHCQRSSRESVSAILDSVQRSSSLVRFDLEAHHLNPFDANSFGPTLELFVSSNSTLEHLGFTVRSRTNGGYYVASLLPFAVRGLRSNRRLVTVDFAPTQESSYPRGPFQVDENLSREVLAILQEANTTLQNIGGLQYESSEHEERINELLELNRHVPDFCANCYRVPMRLWGGVLNRIDKRECNDFVRNLAQQAVWGSRQEEDNGRAARECNEAS